MSGDVPIPARSPTTALLADRSDSIETLLEDLRALARRHSYTTAAKRFGELHRAIEEHTSIEESVWMPRIAEHWPERVAVVEHARADHEAIRAEMQHIGQALCSWDARESLEGLERLHHLLEQHQAHEDEEVYPAVLALKLAQPR